MPGDDDLPRPLRNSSAKAKRTYRKTLASAEETYHDEAAAHRVAYAALKHSFERVEDRWVEKDHKGPSDPRAAHGGPDAPGETFGGVDVAGHTKAELMDRARSLGVRGRSRMTKLELGRAIQKAQR